MTRDPAAEHPWARRMPRGAVTLGAPALVLVGMVVSIASTWSDTDPVSVAEVSSPSWVLFSLLVGTALGTAVMLMVDPHRTVLWAPLVPAAMCWDEATRSIWTVVTGLVLVVAIADRVGVERQRSIAASWPALPAPDLPPSARAALVGRRLVPLAVAALCLVAAVAAAGFWLRDARAAEAFWSEAVRLPGEVVGVPDEDLSVQVRTQDGRQVRVPTPTTYPDVGDRVEILERSSDGRTELVGDPFDPSGALLPAGAGLVLGTGLLGAEAARRRRMRRLLERGGPGLDLLATALDERWVVLHDPAGRRMCVVPVEEPTPVLVGPEDDRSSSQHDDDLGVHHAARGARGSQGGDDEVAWPPEDEWPDLGAMDDEELLAFARTVHDGARATDGTDGAGEEPDASGRDVGDGLGLAPQETFEVRVHGLSTFGDRPLVEILPGAAEVEEGWLEVGAARDRPLDPRHRGLRRERTALLREGWAARTTPASAPLPAAPTRGRPWDAARAGVSGLGRATGTWLPWALLPVGAVLLPLLGRDIGAFVLVGLLWVPGVYAWSTVAHPRVVVGRAGFRVRGAVVGVLVPWVQVRRVLHDEVTVAVRVDPPQDAWLLFDEPELGPVLRGARDTAAVARRLEQGWLRHRVEGGPTWSPTRLPTPSAAVALLWAGVIVATALAS